MICDQTGKECAQPESCAERGCFKERIGSVSFGTQALATTREMGTTVREHKRLTQEHGARNGADVRFA